MSSSIREPSSASPCHSPVASSFTRRVERPPNTMVNTLSENQHRSVFVAAVVLAVAIRLLDVARRVVPALPTHDACAFVATVRPSTDPDEYRNVTSGVGPPSPGRHPATGSGRLNSPPCAPAAQLYVGDSELCE